MSGNTTDLRVVRSKQAIRDALVELIEEKGFEGPLDAAGLKKLPES